MDKRNELLMKAKALAALEKGVIPKSTYGLAFHTVRFVDQGEHMRPREVSVGDERDTPIEALAAAADALGIAPDLTVMALTEDEEAILNDALCNYRDWAEKESESPYKTEEGCKYWRDTAESAESLRLRLCGGA